VRDSVKLLLFAFSILVGAHAAAQTPEDVWPEAEWQRATPEQMGMDSRALATLIDYGGVARMDSLVVTRHGKIVTEVYYAPFRKGLKHRVNSATKGVVSALVGIASARGLIGSTDTPVLDFFPDHKPLSVDERKRQMTLQSLLDMTSGLEWVEPLTDEIPLSLIAMQRSANWEEFILNRPMAATPGSVFNYNSGNSHLLSAIVARKSGMRTDEFAAQHLFKPLGISDVRWRRDPQDVAIGGYGIYMRTPDMARIGYLYLHHGRWKGEQIVPQAWVDKVYGASVPMSLGSSWKYGDQWWTMPERKAYMAVGYARQIIMVLPEEGIVAAMTGRAGYPFENVIDHLRRAAKSPGPLAADAEGAALLQARIDEAASQKAAAVAPQPALAREISGRTLRLASNPMGWKEVTLRLGDAPPSYDLLACANRACSETRKTTRPIGMDGRFAVGDADPALIATQARWTNADTLSILVRPLEEGTTSTYDLRFTGGTRVEITHTDEFGRRSAFTSELQP
jgi:CubicO group peptidase (beta-lactamase class C family)